MRVTSIVARSTLLLATHSCLRSTMASGILSSATLTTSSLAAAAPLSVPAAAAAAGGAGSATAVDSPLTVRVRASADRGFADHGWLKSFHTFSFAGYYEPEFSGFGPLRVINEDTVAGGMGFDRHPHNNWEIFSYVLSGALRHKDSMGNTEIIKRGEVQFTSAGTGIFHSEYNAHPREPVRFLQIWVKPAVRDLKPSYAQTTFTDEDKHNTLRLLLSPDGKDGSLTLHQRAHIYASLLDDGVALRHTLAAADGDGARALPREAAYVHVPIMPGSLGVTVEGVRLHPGDGAFIYAPASGAPASADLRIEGHAEGGARAEFLLFDFAR